MRSAIRIAWLSLLATGMIGPIALAAQEAAASKSKTPIQKPGLPTTELEKQGEALFWKDCTLCHIDRSSPRFNHRGRNTLGIVAPNDLIGLFKSPSKSDETVRQVIREGLPERMPAFQYTYELKPQALDQLIAYLKVR